MEKVVTDFIIKISKEHDISEKVLLKKWKTFNLKSNEKIEPKKVIENTEMNEKSLNSITVVKLKELCKSKNLKVTGRKSELIDRLLGRDNNDTKTVTKEVKTVVKKPTSKQLKENDKIEENSSILQKLKNIPKIAIRKNTFGNFCHPETNLVFVHEDGKKKAIGRQLDDGTIGELNKDDINNCKKLNVSYSIPQNLETDKDENKEEESDSEIFTEEEEGEEEEEEDSDEEEE